MKVFLQLLQMLQKMKYKINFGTKTKIFALLGVFILAVGLGYQSVKRVNEWFTSHELVFNQVVNLELKRPIEIIEREVATQEIIRIIETIPAPEDLETDIEHYIYEKFGIENYRLALAIAMAESHMNCNAIGLNETSVDLGLFQVNSLWLKDYSLLQLADCKGNVDAAYRIWDRGDGEEGNGKGSFNPWTVAKNGAYLKYLE